MKKNKITRNTLKFIISLEVFLYGVLGLVVSAWYFARDYYDFIEHSNDPSFFWIGFLLLSIIIISSTLILIGIGIMFIIVVNWWDKKHYIQEENND